MLDTLPPPAVLPVVYSIAFGLVLRLTGLRLFINNIDKSPWFDAFRNVEKLKKVHDIPMLLIHGRLDRQVCLSAVAAAADVFMADLGSGEVASSAFVSFPRPGGFL